MKDGGWAKRLVAVGAGAALVGVAVGQLTVALVDRAELVRLPESVVGLLDDPVARGLPAVDEPPLDADPTEPSPPTAEASGAMLLPPSARPAVAAGGAERRRQSRGDGRSKKAVPSGEQPAAKGLPTTAYTVSRARLQAELRSGEDLARHVRIIPAYRGGERIGFKAYQVTPGGLADRYGLRPGDVIVSINGVSMATSQQDALAELQAMRGRPTHTAVVERDGERRRLVYRVDP